MYLHAQVTCAEREPRSGSKLCFAGNLYPTTIHTLDAAIRKLAKVALASTVYRGMGTKLEDLKKNRPFPEPPASFQHADVFMAKGGCEIRARSG